MFTEFTDFPSLHKVANFHLWLCFCFYLKHLCPFSSPFDSHTLRSLPGKYALPTSNSNKPYSDCSSCLSTVLFLSLTVTVSRARFQADATGSCWWPPMPLSVSRGRWQRLCSGSHLLLPSIHQVPSPVIHVWHRFTSVTSLISQNQTKTQSSFFLLMFFVLVTVSAVEMDLEGLVGKSLIWLARAPQVWTRSGDTWVT